jgi:hypothetical protein
MFAGSLTLLVAAGDVDVEAVLELRERGLLMNVFALLQALLKRFFRESLWLCEVQ